MANPKHPQKNTEHFDNVDVFAMLSDNQWRYVTAMIENPSFSARKAAEHLGMSEGTIYGWTKDAPYVAVALERARANIHEAALSMRKQALLKALAVKLALLDSDDEIIRNKASSEIIEWELGKSVTRNEITGANGNALQIKIVYDANEDTDTDLS